MMKGWVGFVGWPVADGLPTVVVIHQLQVEHGTGKVCLPETDVLPLFNATNPTTAVAYNYYYHCCCCCCCSEYVLCWHSGT